MLATLVRVREDLENKIQDVQEDKNISRNEKEDFNQKVDKHRNYQLDQLVEAVESLEKESAQIVELANLIDEIKNASKIEEALESLKKIEQYIPPERWEIFKNEVELKGLELTRQSIDVLSKKASSSKVEGWKDLKKVTEREERIVQCYNPHLSPQVQQELEANLRWMVEKGKQKELHLIQYLKQDTSFWNGLPEPSKTLINTAEERISKKLKRGMKYRIFCSKENLSHISEISEYLSDIYITDIYPSFIMVSISEELSETIIPAIKTYFPLEKWETRSNLGASDSTKDHNSNKKASPMKSQVIQFSAPVREQWRERITNTGATILQPLSRSEIVVSVPDEKAVEELKKLEEIARVTPFQPKISVKLEDLKVLGQEVTEEMIVAAMLKSRNNQEKFQQRSFTLPGILIAEFFTEEYRDSAAQELQEKGITILDNPGKTKLILDLSSGKNAKEFLDTITEQPGLESLEEDTIPQLFNYHAGYCIARGIIPNNSIPSCSLTGEGEIIAIADSGLDTGSETALHPDFKGRVQSIQSYPVSTNWNPYISNPGSDDGPADLYSGHGTHVAGSALGNGRCAEELGLSITPKGIAPGARLVFQAIEQTVRWNEIIIDNCANRELLPPPAVSLRGIPRELTQLFDDAFIKGARIHSNSWGGGKYGEYNDRCKDLDKFVWEHKDFLIVVAAGNSGSEGNETVNPPGTAKNCLTVGASENNHVAPYSSRGPCQDGRLKPDVIAPGTSILSTRSSELASSNFVGEVYRPTNGYYIYMDGTSMATPLVAGSAALVRQYLRSPERGEEIIDNPSAALLKAALIHSAEYLNNNNDKNQQPPWFDNKQGWGRIKLQEILNPTEPKRVFFIDVNEEQGLTTEKEKHQYKIKVTDSSIPLRVTLVYTDYYGTKSDDPTKCLINNLNLKLCAPNNKYYCGNDQEGTGEIDSINNVEGIIIPSPVLGKWQIEIVAETKQNQDYALVVSGAILNVERIYSN